MKSSSSNLVDNLAKGIECKYGQDNQKCETCRLKYKDCECCLEYRNFKDDLTEYKCFCRNKNYQKRFYENLKKEFVIHINFLSMISINLFYCCEKVFTHTNIWMVGKNSENFII